LSFILGILLGLIDRILDLFVGKRRKDLGVQSIELPDSKEIKGETKPRINPLCKKGLTKTAIDGVFTINEAWDWTVKKHSDRPCMGKRTLKRIITKDVILSNGTKKNMDYS